MLKPVYKIRTLFLMTFIVSVIGSSASCQHPQNTTLENSPSANQPNKPFADIHLHYNWDQEEIIDAATVVKRLQSENVVLGVVSSMPSDNALKLREAAGEWIIPLFSPYITPPHRQSWYLDEKVVDLARDGLANKKYFGIGELHLWSGLPPRTDNKILLSLFELAEQYDVPFLLHTESSDARYIIAICQRHHKVRILWAHAGGILKAEDVENVMTQCPNIWVELSARDPWRYNSLVNDRGTLPDDWRKLIVTYPNRFMTGSDPVWGVTKTQRWDEPDEGWDHLHNLITFHRQWLASLPADTEERVRLTNALEFFRKQPSP
jgi:predicted TIM-barrel fold metal-dependent hydrolase